MAPKNSWSWINLSCSKGLFLFGALILTGCELKTGVPNSNDSKLNDFVFNNDSARSALLNEYLYERDHPNQQLIDTLWNKKTVDFSEIFPVFADNCIPCHCKNGNGPFVLTSYESIRKKSAVIRDVMMERIMPPWMADNKYSAQANAPRINDSIRWRIVNWIDQGTLPAKLSYDTKIKAFHPRVNRNSKTYYADEHTVNSNSDSYQCFIIDLDLKKDTFVKSLKFHSSNARVIHHIMVYLDTSGILNTYPKCWNCMKEGFVNQLMPIDAWSKGMVPCELTEDFAYKFPKGSKLLLQTHYGDEGNLGQKERTSIDITFDSKPKREVKFEILNNLDIYFPANTVKTETIKFYTDSAISIIGGGPHLHFLAKKIEIFAITKELKKINLLKINNWDYLWQGNYFQNKLVEIPAKSTIYMNAVFDNTDKNPQQPNQPIRNVKYAPYSNEEMMVLSLYFTSYKTGDKNIQAIRLSRKS